MLLAETQLYELEDLPITFLSFVNLAMTTSSCNHEDSHFDYAIVGGGCFGASTALALKRE